MESLDHCLPPLYHRTTEDVRRGVVKLFGFRPIKCEDIDEENGNNGKYIIYVSRKKLCRGRQKTFKPTAYLILESAVGVSKLNQICKILCNSELNNNLLCLVAPPEGFTTNIMRRNPIDTRPRTHQLSITVSQVNMRLRGRNQGARAPHRNAISHDCQNGNRLDISIVGQIARQVSASTEPSGDRPSF
ncbi:hypothetical protein J6590_036719 [Homalodisca vitripennis]|nr:hypothetical protein J6590_036719 [Homalodisca vitripennis]